MSLWWKAAPSKDPRLWKLGQCACAYMHVCTFIVSLACEVPDVNSHTTYNLYLYLNTHSRQTYRIPIDSSLEASAPATAAKRKGSLCYDPLRRVLPPRFRLVSPSHSCWRPCILVYTVAHFAYLPLNTPSQGCSCTSVRTSVASQGKVFCVPRRTAPCSD